jgi:outer membrane protein assembly factor BamB
MNAYVSIADPPSLAALDLMSGTERWSIEQPENKVFGRLAQADSLFLFPSSPVSGVTAFDAGTGAQRWARGLPDFGSPSGNAVASDGVIYVASIGRASPRRD